jgi:hypothetical protein
MPVKEWPLPIGRTRAPLAAAVVSTAATSSVDAGRTTSATARWLPAQLRQWVRFPVDAGASVTPALWRPGLRGSTRWSG